MTAYHHRPAVIVLKTLPNHPPMVKNGFYDKGDIARKNRINIWIRAKSETPGIVECRRSLSVVLAIGLGRPNGLSRARSFVLAGGSSAVVSA